MTQENDARLSTDEIERYARHIILPEIGGQGQQKLKKARVAVVGAGGLGAPVLIYLAAAGVGTVGIIDDDDVSLSNLQRQVIHETSAIGKPKVDSAAQRLKAINPHVCIEQLKIRLDKTNVEAIMEKFDIIVDGSDNFTTRYILADYAELLEKPLVSGAIGRFDGSLTVLMPFASNNPSYRDIFPNPPPKGVVPSCAQAGVIGTLPAVIGSLMAMEVIKLVTGAGEPLIGKLLLYDGLHTRFDTIYYQKRKPPASIS